MRLERWAAAHGGVLAKGLRLEAAPQGGGGAGAGAVATRALDRGVVLVRVPEVLLMTADTAAASDAECVSTAARSGALTDWQTLCAHLAWERRRGESSFWAPYIAYLPDQRDHPLGWDCSTLDALLGQASPMRAQIEERQEVVRADWRAICAAGVALDEEEVRWAAATLLSRSFELGGGGGGEGWRDDPRALFTEAPGTRLALAPLADALNHCSAAGAEFEWAPAPHERFAELRAGKVWREGDQVYNVYAEALSPCDLFVDYAFVEGRVVGSDASTAAGPDAIDVDVTVLLPHGAPTLAAGLLRDAAESCLACGSARVDVCGTRAVDVMRLLGCGAYGAASDALAASRLANATEAELAETLAFYNGDSVDPSSVSGLDALRAFGSPVGRSNELRALGALARALENLADDTHAEAEQDRHAADWLPDGVVACAAEARSSERRAALGASALLREWEARLGERGETLAALYGLDDDDEEPENEAVLASLGEEV